MLECQTYIRYVIVLAILHILIGIGLTNKLQNKCIELHGFVELFTIRSS